MSERTVRKRVSSLKPSPENERLYRPADQDPDILALAESIKRYGLQEPLIVTADNYIVSGHRRHAALQHIGRGWVECRVLPVRRDSMPADEYLALLREHNRQRVKTAAEHVRETLLDIDPDEAHENLRRLRDRSVHAPEYNGIVPLEIEGTKRRYGISEDKAEHVKYVKKIVFEERKDYWPLTVRGVHYPLLNYKFVRGYCWPHRGKPGFGTKQTLAYKNDDGSYDATSDLLTRLRLRGEIPWEALTDGTRPFREYRAFRDVRQFVRQKADRLFRGYWRDLLQSQPNRIEVVCEKNTIYHMVERVTDKYQVPPSSGRGFNSIDPWHEMAERFLRSGKQRLIVIVLTDHDPEGQMIPQVGGRTLRDDFELDNVTIIQAGVTRDQIMRYNLATMNFAKETSSNYDWYVERNRDWFVENGYEVGTVWELEALDPADMLRDLDGVIRAVLDIDLFNAEVAREREDAVYLEALGRRAPEILRGLID
jgi:ParB-like nuclease domain